MDQAFSVPKCVKLASMSEKLYELLSKTFSAVPERTKEELEPMQGKKYIGYACGNFSDFEKQKQKGSTATDFNAVDENDEIHRVMMEVEPLLEASGRRNWRSIMLTHDEFPCHCLLQAQQSVQCVSAGRWSRSFPVGFCNSSECNNHSSEKDF